MTAVLEERSLWLQEALSREDDTQETPPLDGDAKVDVAIAGGGFTGLWTAIRLKEAQPALDVAILERDICGGGASGRNGGFVLGWWAKYLTLEAVCGREGALRLCRASQDAVTTVGDFCREHAPEANFRPDGWLWAATSPAQRGAWTETVDALQRLQANPFVELEPDEAAAKAGSRRHLAGVFDPTCATVQPAMLARGLRRRALALGVRIHEGTPVTRLVRSHPPVLETPSGRLVADKVVLATNAWAIREPEVQRAIAVTSSDVIATPRIPTWCEKAGRTDGLGISDSRMMVHYYRTTSDGRMVFGKGGGNGALAFGRRVSAAFDGRSDYAGTVARWLRWTYPDLPDEPPAFDWTGPIDKSLDGLPHFGGLEGRADILYGVGFSGNGVGPTVLGGRILASLVLERDDEWANCGLVRPLVRAFPPEPVRYLGGRIVARAVARVDAANDAGRMPGPLTRRLAALAPVSLTPVKDEAE